MRSETRLPSAALALARLLSAIEDFSVTATICSFWAKSSSCLLGLLQPQLQLLELILEEGLGVGVSLEALVEVRGDEGVGEAVAIFCARHGLGSG